MQTSDLYRSADFRVPGVYIEEARPEDEAQFFSGVPAFVGFAEIAGAQPGNPKPVLLTRREQFDYVIRRTVFGSFLDYAVRGFFANGGRRCFAVPVLPQRGNTAGELANALLKPFTSGGLLEDLADIDLVCVPDAMIPDLRGWREAVLEIQHGVLEHCSRMNDRFAILDCLPSDGARSDLRRHVDHTSELFKFPRVAGGDQIGAANGALYCPWIGVEALPRASDTARSSARVLVPPCGHVAGVYARTDTAAGSQKAPANEVLEGVVDVEIEISGAAQSELNDAGVNCLRAFPTRGVRVWGARTLSPPQSPWRYINVRRLFLGLARWIEQNMNDLVFEENTPELWMRVRGFVASYCYDLYRRGVLQGETAADAFFVKCDAETNPPELRNLGRLICEVGLAPAVPAEFIVVRITRNSAGTTMAMPLGF